MKCYYHNDRDAVATCQNCGKSLCKECADKYSPILCDDCYNALEAENKKDYKAQKRHHIIRFIIQTLIGLFLALICYAISDSWIGLLTFFLAFGWYQSEDNRLLNAVTLSGNSSVAVVHIICMALSFCIKLALCVVLGIPFFIRDTIKLIKYLIPVSDQSAVQ